MTKYPVTAGKLKITVQVPPGSDCNSITPGFPIKTSITITFQGINPKTGKLATASSAVKSTLASYSQASRHRWPSHGGSALREDHQPVLLEGGERPPDHRRRCGSPWVLCSAKGGLKVMHLNNGPSSLTLS